MPLTGTDHQPPVMRPGRRPYVRYRTEEANPERDHYRVCGEQQEVNVNRDRLEGKWKQFSGTVREQWGRLTGDWLSVVAGRHDRAAGEYQERYGINKEKGDRQLREFRRRHRDWDPSGR